MFAKISRFFIYAALLAPLLIIKASFFPFITGKAIFFRVLVELALLFFLIHVLAHIKKGQGKVLFTYLKKKLTHPIVICTAVFAVVFTLTAGTGVNPTGSFWSNFERGEGAFQILHYVGFFILTVLLFPNLKRLRGLLAAQVIIRIPVCVYALAQLVRAADQTNSGFILAAGERVSGTLGNPSYLACYLLFTLPLILYFFLQTKNPAWRTGLALLFGFELFILLKTGTRGAFLAILVGLFILGIIALIRTKHVRLRYGLLVVLGLGIALIAFFFATRAASFWEHVPVFNRLINFESATSDIRPRIWTWNSAVKGVLDKPILGYGAENFAVPFDRYYNPGHYGIESFFDRTHNIFLEYLITGGIALLIPWLAIFYFYYRRLRKRQKDFWQAIFFTMPIVYFVQGFFLFDVLAIYLVFFLWLAFAITAEQESELPFDTAPIAIPFPSLLGAGALTALIVASLYFTAYLPAKKNQLLVRALLLQNQLEYEVSAKVAAPTVSPGTILDAFDTALNFKSPVGQEETIGMLQKFSIYVVDALGQNPKALASPQAASDVRGLVEKNNSWFDKNQAIMSGIKNLYLNGGLNLRAGLDFKQPDLLARGKSEYQQGLSISPTRLEFIRVLIEVAKIEKDQAAYADLVARAKELRPDLVWQ